MSFPRAKIQRFNDTTSCAPPPGSYDPKFDDKIKGAVIEKKGRFVEAKCSSQCSNSAESPANISVSSGSTKSTGANCLPVFRTPQPPKKTLKHSNSTPQLKLKLKFDQTQKNSSVKEVDAEMYGALLVDRDNKDATIKENETHIDELYEQIRHKEKLLEELQMEKGKLIEEHEIEIKKSEEMELKIQERMKELEDLKLELQETNAKLSEAKDMCQNLETLIAEKKLLVNSLSDENAKLLIKVKNLEDKEAELKRVCKKLEDDFSALESVKVDLEAEVKIVKENLGALSNEKCDLECKLSQKQQMILMLQSELSSAGLDLEECKSENEKLLAELKEEKCELKNKHVCEMKEMRELIVKLEKLLVEERMLRNQDIQAFEENLLNSSMARDNLEAAILDHENALASMSEKHKVLQIAYEETEEERKELLLKFSTLKQDYEKQILEIKTKTHEKEMEVEKVMMGLMESSVKEMEMQVKEIRTEAEDRLTKYKDAVDSVLQNYECETTKKLKDYELTVETKIKDCEGRTRQLIDDASSSAEELRKMKHAHDELRISNMDHQLTIVDLQDKIDTFVTELNSTRESYESDLKLIQSEHEIAKRSCKKLTIGINNLQASLEALQKRLLESEHDVEQLTIAVKQAETQKEAAEAELKKFKMKFEINEESMIHLEKETVQQIEEMEGNLLKKLEEFKMQAERNITSKEEEILEHRHKMEDMSAKLFELNETLSALEETNSEHEHEIEALTEKLDHQRDCAQIATQQISTLEASNAIYQHQIQALTAELDFQKNYCSKASDHITNLANVKASQEKQIKDLSAELDIEREKVSKFNCEITNVKTCHEKEIKDLTAELENEREKVSKLNLKFANLQVSKEGQIKDLSAELNNKREKISKLNNEISNMKASQEKQIKYLSTELDNKTETISNLSYEIEVLKTEFKNYRNEVMHVLLGDSSNTEAGDKHLQEFKQTLNSTIQNRLKEKEDSYKSLLEKAALVEEMEKRCKELESVIGPFRQQLEAFEAERKILASKKEAAEGEIRELSLRYAEILGHQNHKQKIKHLVKLKEHNLELTKEVEKLEAQVRAQKRIIDKLKDERGSASARKQILQPHNQQTTKGKENLERSACPKSPIGSPSKKPIRRKLAENM